MPAISAFTASVAWPQPLSMIGIDWHLGDVVRTLRDRKGWTQRQLGLKAKRPRDKKPLDKATIVSVERMDRNHGNQTYERIAFAFGLTLAQLYALIPHAEVTRREVPDTDVGQHSEQE
jgi:transcriptional regulator with XRE-family HTH domain